MLAILGGGIAGLAAAAEADRLGLSYQLFEASPELGGNARTFEVDGFRFDAGAHRLHDRVAGVTERVRSWLGDDLARVDAPSRIHHGGTYLDFPLNPANLLRRLSPFEGLRAVASYAGARLRRRAEPQNFRDLCHARFGAALADPFLIRYSEKLWGVPAAELSTEIAGRRLEGLSLRTLMGRSRSARHLEGSFLYPSRGIGAIADAMVERCSGDSLKVGRAVTALEHDGGRIHAVVTNGCERLSVDQVISTVPLALQAQLLRPAADPGVLEAAKGLQYRHVILVAVFLDRPRASPYASTYYPGADVPFTRVHEPNARSVAMSPAGKTSLVAELVRFESDADWHRSDDDLASDVVRALARTGAIQTHEVLGQSVHRLRNAYPVLRTDAKERAERLRESQEGFRNLALVGRAATFRYLHIHDLMGGAVDAVQRMVRPGAEASLEVAS